MHTPPDQTVYDYGTNVTNTIASRTPQFLLNTLNANLAAQGLQYNLGSISFPAPIMETSFSTTETTTSGTVTPVFMTLSVEPSVLPACSGLVLNAAPPESTQEVRWTCVPSLPQGGPLCDRIDEAAKRGSSNVVVTEAVVQSAAADAINGGGQGMMIDITITASAHGITAGRSAFAEYVFTFEPSASVVMRQQPGAVQFTVLDEYITLAVEIEWCVSPPSGSTNIQWSWRPQGTAAYTAYTGSTLKTLRLPTSELPGPGSYDVRAASTSLGIETVFVITLLPAPPPIVVLVAPAPGTQINHLCDVRLDASQSQDPQDPTGASLTYEWRCIPGSNIVTAVIDAPAIGGPLDLLSGMEGLLWSNACEGGGVLSTAPTHLITSPFQQFPFYGSIDVQVTVSRASDGANSSEVVTVRYGGDATPTVNMATLSSEVMTPTGLPKISRDRHLVLPAVVDLDCVVDDFNATFWKAWYLRAENETGHATTETFLTEQLDEATFRSSLIEAPQQTWSSVVPGEYRLRLVLSQTPTNGQGYTLGTDFIFDSVPFVIDTPPTGGNLQVSPTTGLRSSTFFFLASTDWTDEAEDLAAGPLEYRFSWGAGSSTNYDGTSLAMTLLSGWTRVSTMPDVLLYELGTITLRVEVRNVLGSTSFAYSEVTVREPGKRANITELLDSVSVVYANGNDYATMNAIIAAAQEAHGEGVQDELVRYTELATASVITAPSADGVRVMALTVDNVVDAGTKDSSSTRIPSTMEFAQSSVNMIIASATAASQLSGGLECVDASSSQGVAQCPDGSPANSLLSSISHLVPTLGAVNLTVNETRNITAQQALSGRVDEAMGLLLDGLLIGMSVGQEVQISTENAIVGVRKENQEVMCRPGRPTDVGGFVFQDLSSLPLCSNETSSSVRRLTGSCTSTDVGMQYTSWSRNPYAYIGNEGLSTTNADIQQSLSTIPYTDWSPGDGIRGTLSVAGQAVKTMALRQCGQDIEVSNLDEDIIFEIQAPASGGVLSVANTTSANEWVSDDGWLEFRLCQYFDVARQTWSGENCSVVSMSATSVVCACNHLTAFTAMYGYVDTLEGATRSFFLCANAEAMSAQALSILFEFDWLNRPSSRLAASVVLGLLVFIAVFHAIASYYERQSKRDKNRDRRFLQVKASGLEFEPAKRVDVNRVNKLTPTYGKFLTATMFSVLWFFEQWVDNAKEDLDDLSGKGLIHTIKTLLASRCMQILTSTELGFSVDDMPLVSQGKLMEEVKSIADKADKVMDAAEDKLLSLSQEFLTSIDVKLNLAGTSCSTNIWEIATFFKAMNPMWTLMFNNLRLPVKFQTVALCDSIFGSMLMAVLFFTTFGGARKGGTLECEPTDFSDKVFRDIMISTLSAIVGYLPVWAFFYVHRKEMTVVESEEDIPVYLKRWKYRDRLLLGSGLVYFVVCLVVIFTFIAQASNVDCDHWMVSLATRLAIAWFLLPLLAALFWEVVAILLRRDPKLYRNTVANIRQAMLPKSRKQADKRFWNWVDEQKLREVPQRLPDDDSKSPEARTAPPPLRPPPRGRVKFPPPPELPPTPQLGPSGVPTPASPYAGVTRVPSATNNPQFWDWVTQLRAAAAPPVLQQGQQGSPEVSGLSATGTGADLTETDFWSWAGDFPSPALIPDVAMVETPPPARRIPLPPRLPRESGRFSPRPPDEPREPWQRTPLSEISLIPPAFSPASTVDRPSGAGLSRVPEPPPGPHLFGRQVTPPRDPAGPPPGEAPRKPAPPNREQTPPRQIRPVATPPMMQYLMPPSQVAAPMAGRQSPSPIAVPPTPSALRIPPLAPLRVAASPGQGPPRPPSSAFSPDAPPVSRELPVLDMSAPLPGEVNPHFVEWIEQLRAATVPEAPPDASFPAPPHPPPPGIRPLPPPQPPRRTAPRPPPGEPDEEDFQRR